MLPEFLKQHYVLFGVIVTLATFVIDSMKEAMGAAKDNRRFSFASWMIRDAWDYEAPPICTVLFLKYIVVFLIWPAYACMLLVIFMASVVNHIYLRKNER